MKTSISPFDDAVSYGLIMLFWTLSMMTDY
jgi:hypothetical protein